MPDALSDTRSSGSPTRLDASADALLAVLRTAPDLREGAALHAVLRLLVLDDAAIAIPTASIGEVAEAMLGLGQRSTAVPGGRTHRIPPWHCDLYR